jgi:hypothetical protein
MTAFWDIVPCILIEIYRGAYCLSHQQTVSTSETSVYFYKTTRFKIPEDCYVHTRRRENLKSHNILYVSTFLIPSMSATFPAHHFFLRDSITLIADVVKHCSLISEGKDNLLLHSCVCARAHQLTL